MWMKFERSGLFMALSFSVNNKTCQKIATDIYVIAGSVRIVKNCDLGLENAALCGLGLLFVFRYFLAVQSSCRSYVGSVYRMQSLAVSWFLIYP